MSSGIFHTPKLHIQMHGQTKVKLIVIIIIIIIIITIELNVFVLTAIDLCVGKILSFFAKFFKAYEIKFFYQNYFEDFAICLFIIRMLYCNSSQPPPPFYIFLYF